MTLTNLLFKKNLDQVIRRNKDFWLGNSGNKILAKIEIDGCNTFEMWTRVLSPEYCPDYKKMFDVYIENFYNRKDLLDDGTPTARPEFGSAVFGAFFGADLKFGKSGGYAKPILEKIDDIYKMDIDFNNYWFQQQIKAMDYFADNSEGKCAVTLPSFLESLDLAENLFGSKVYIYLKDHPGKMRDLFEKSFEFSKEFIRILRKKINKYNGGYFDIHEEWLPGDSSWHSIDAWSYCSAQMFRELGKPILQKTFNYWGGGWLHMHNSALHLLEEVSTIKNILGIGLLDDPNQERCFPRLKEIQKMTRGIPLQINCTKNDLLDGLSNKTLPRNVMYWVSGGVKTVKEANSIMEIVRYY